MQGIYNQWVARGWESKSVEAQQAEAGDKSAKPRTKLSVEQAARAREREKLRLSRQTVLRQLESAVNERHREQLKKALADLDDMLRRFGS